MGLQLKLFSIYILALALSGCIVAIFLQEIKVIREIESDKDAMRRQYSVMEDVRSRVIELYATGEYVLGWDENDYDIYRETSAKHVVIFAITQSQVSNSVTSVINP